MPEDVRICMADPMVRAEKIKALRALCAALADEEAVNSRRTGEIRSACCLVLKCRPSRND